MDLNDGQWVLLHVFFTRPQFFLFSISYFLLSPEISSFKFIILANEVTISVTDEKLKNDRYFSAFDVDFCLNPEPQQFILSISKTFFFFLGKIELDSLFFLF